MTRETIQVRDFILSCLRPSLSAIGLKAADVPEGFDLRATGVIDSFGFVQLLGRLQARFDCPIDLSQVPPEQLTQLDVLSRHIAEQIPPAEAISDTVGTPVAVKHTA